jgi:Na+-translocating ferredoxin:NAD+ oxidoreductase RNF subunit RnfB
MTIVLPVVFVAGIGVFAGVLLTVAAKFMSVPVDERVTDARALLPGANCGACGFAGCDEYAEKLVHGDAPKNLCTPGGGAVAAQLAGLLGGTVEEVVAKAAIVKCSGRYGSTEYIMDYQGPQTCEGNNYFYQGRGSCSHACLGFGDCVAACQYGALSIVDGVAAVDKDLCTGCGMCAAKCPNHLIQIVPAASEVYVGCSSTDTGAFVRKVCKAGCIGCKRCEKACEFGAIAIGRNLAAIDPAKCTNCGKCVEICPTKVIHINKYSACK